MLLITGYKLKLKKNSQTNSSKCWLQIACRLIIPLANYLAFLICDLNPGQDSGLGILGEFAKQTAAVQPLGLNGFGNPFAEAFQTISIFYGVPGGDCTEIGQQTGENSE